MENNSTIQTGKLSIREKICYAFGDGAANIAWRGVAAFLMIYYTDVFGLSPAVVGTLMLLVRLSDGVSDVAMGAICDRTKTKYGKFRPWILWTAIPLAVILSMMFTCPDWSMTGKIAYAYTTYIVFTLVYTANNIPYGALLAVMTPDDKERTSLGSFRMVGAFGGGMLVQGLLLFLVAYFGNVNPNVNVNTIESGKKYEVVLTTPTDVSNLSFTTNNGIAKMVSPDITYETKDSTGALVVGADGKVQMKADELTEAKSFATVANKPYHFTVEAEGEEITADSFRVVDQNKGYSYAIYFLSIFLAIFLLITFFGTRERVEPPVTQKTNLVDELGDLIKNYPWIVLVFVGILYNIYNNTRQGVTLYYFTHYVHNQLLSAGYMTGLMIASIVGAMITAPLSRKFGKKNLFIGALFYSAVVNTMLYFCSPTAIVPIFCIGMLSEVGAAIFPTLFFAMLGDVADYSEYVNGRRATGLVYSAGSFATKFGGGLGSAIVGYVLAYYGYKGTDPTTIKLAVEGIRGLMSWIPSILCIFAAVGMYFYTIDQKKMDEITTELQNRRRGEGAKNAVSNDVVR